MSKYIPNAFQIPNVVIDDHMATMSGTAFKCYAFIIRKTMGWNKDIDYIPVSQFLVACGIKKKDTIGDALSELEEIGLIDRVQSRGKVTGYRLKLNEETNPENGGDPDKEGDPENGGVVTPNNGVGSNPENGGTSKPNTKPTITKPITSDLDGYELPEIIPVDAWNEYMAQRKKKKLATSDYAKTLLVNKLVNFAAAGHNPADLLNEAIINGWKSVWEPKSFLSGAPASRKPSIKDIPDHTASGGFEGGNSCSL